MNSAWNTHQWIGSRGYVVRQNDRLLGLHRRCSLCGRDFLLDVESGTTHAVRVAGIRFERLAPRITARWLSERCPKKVIGTDDDDRTQLFVGSLEL